MDSIGLGGLESTICLRAIVDATSRTVVLWLACHTQEEIAKDVGVTQGEIAKSIPNGDISELNKSQQPAAEHAVDFEVPLYNIWRQHEKTPRA